ncbi:MAG: hypothetical protein ACI4J6_04110 [Oscillospiraceae bacterium]
MYKTPEELRRERDKRLTDVWAAPCDYNIKYGYQLNVSNIKLNVLYEAYKKYHNIYGAPSDRQRVAWESEVLNVIKKEYKRIYRICPPIEHCDDARLRELINNIIDVDAIKNKLWPKKRD